MSEATRLPDGWDEERVRRLREYYESQSDDDAAAEHEAAHRSGVTWMQIPSEFVSEVRKVLARKPAS